MSKARSKALVLDFGGVVTKTLFETHAQTERALGLEPGQLHWRGPFDPAGDALWRAMQNDEITERDYWLTRARETGALIGKNWTKMSEFLIAARGDAPGDIVRPEFLDTLKRVKEAGCTVAILSNELDLFYGPDFKTRLSFLGLIDVIHDATYTKTLKPDPVAYQNLTNALELPPAACVFVDDQKRNVDGAQGVGMQTVHFDVMHPGESYAKAEALLGLDERISA